MAARRTALCALALALAGCGAAPRDASLVPRPVGPGARFRPPVSAADALHGAPVAGLRCSPAGAARFGMHVEVFAAGRVVVVPAGIGLAAPLRRAGAYVRGARCAYPLMTSEPTGLVEVARGTRATLGSLFALWGQPLGPRGVAGFRGAVRVHVGGRTWRGDPRTVPLAPHAQVVVQVGPPVVPHARYRFPPGL